MEYLGNYDIALLYARKFKNISDSLSEIKQSNNLKLLQAGFEFESEQEKSNTQIQQLTAENEIQDLRLRERNLFIIISLVTFLAIGIIGYLVYNQRLVKRKKEANDLKQKLLRLQLNPHFTYNSLNAIQSMIYEEEHRQKAADYLAQFSGLMREILELNRKDLVTLEEEISVMKNYVAVQQIRFDSPLQFKLSIDFEVSAEELLVPPMITQPFLENSLEHGFADKSGDWELILNISEKEKELQIEIIDNGVGLEATVDQVSTHESLATKITEDRLRILGRKFTSQASLEIFDRSKLGEGQGTHVTIKLPMIYD
ncbi:MAG: histidine kinase [Bacteroidota bacterium]